ncbi:MAG: hypothetical protein ACD_23C00624G0001 [uncultured bacterium]|nr:MAG: hypothetical protein ACD_23C00624G0001 [uncultured bacterium]
MQHLATGQGSAYAQARAAALFRIHVILGNGHKLIHGQTGLGDDEARHELGQRCNGQHRMVVLADQNLIRVLVDHEGHAGL